MNSFDLKFNNLLCCPVHQTRGKLSMLLFPFHVQDKQKSPKSESSCAAFNGWLLFLMVLYATTKSG